jgi:hypothetical protein
MGSVSAMSSINRVLEKHSDEIRQEFMEQVPEGLKPFVDRVDLENNLYGINVTWVFKAGGTLPGPAIDIDTLADDYPDCEVGY